MAQLRGRQGLEIVPPSADADAAVVIGWQVDGPLLTRCRTLAHDEGLPVVLVVARMREGDLMNVVECGVSSVLWRHEATGARLTGAVLGARRGEGDLPPELLGRLLARIGAPRGRGERADFSPTQALTDREVDILRLIAEGLDNREIAAKISYSERTVKSVLHGVMGRLKLRNRAHAVAYAAREGYL